ncbi:uncharacterized protein LOC135488565 [Lineus longissimus]|uniref:uncharacterized protein LOC135488565 n=1 Tax=Lineus longissimus TaxID=88925 RepID=UPI00315DEC3F
MPELGSEAGEGGGESTQTAITASLTELRAAKAKFKTAFTKARRHLIETTREEEANRDDILEANRKVDKTQDTVMQTLEKIVAAYEKLGQQENVERTLSEMDKMESEFSETQASVERFFDTFSRVGPKRDNIRNSVVEETCTSASGDVHDVRPTLGHDIWRQLKRVDVPKFTGNVKTYSNWNAAFTACIDKAPATPEYKLLQLREHLSGDALKLIESLRHSPAAYEAAKERLERKYGGDRRQINLQLEELTNFPPLRPGKPGDIERFSDILDLTMINLKESGLLGDLDSKLLYSVMMRKMTEGMLTSYQRWVHENNFDESIYALRKFVLREAEYRTVAYEAIHGVGAENQEPKSDSNDRSRQSNRYRESTNRAHFTGTPRNNNNNCELCDQTHGIWACDVFKRLEINKRWEKAKHLALCYRCLGRNHLGSKCERTRECGIDECKETHHRLLHGKRTSVMPARKDTEEKRERDRNHSTVTLKTTDQTNEEKFISMRTVPVIVKNGKRRIKVNAMLDDCSTTTYINADVAAELGLQGEIQKTTVQVLNGKTETFDSMPVQIGLESLNHRIDMNIIAKTTNNVTGDLKAIDWNQYADRYEHLRDIGFPKFGRRDTVDLLIGQDYQELHLSLRDIRGKTADAPMARLTKLGWTCIGAIDGQGSGRQSTNFTRTYFTQSRQIVMDEINQNLRRFWEVEDYRMSEKDFQVLKPEEQAAMETVKNSLTHDGE